MFFPRADEASLFKIQPSSGQLAVGETCTIRFTFAPIAAVNCAFALPLCLDNDPSAEYLPVQIAGTGCYPQLTFDRREIILPTVPVGVTSVSSRVVALLP